MRREIERLLKQADRGPGQRPKESDHRGVRGRSVLGPASGREVSQGYLGRYEEGAGAVPSELYDESTARTKIQNAEAVIQFEGTPEKLRADPIIQQRFGGV